MELKGLSISFGTQKIFENINLHIPENEKIGVVGVNGAGKTTLFKIMLGLENPDSGEVVIKKGYRIDWLPQTISDDENIMSVTVLDYLLSARPIQKLNEELQTYYENLAFPNENQKELYRKIDKIERELNYWDSYNAENTLLKIIEGFKLDEEILLKKIRELSGGQKSKVAFIRLLYSNPEIMLLDEPTNHLDEDSKKYIISYLKSCKGTILIISHDIEFLNQVTNKTLFIDKRTKTFDFYDGNYDKFIKLQKEKEESIMRQVHIQEVEEEKLKSIITKYATASGKKKKMAQDREKKLERLEKNKIEIIKPNKKVDFSMEISRKGNAVPLEVKDLSFSYDNNKDIIHNLSFRLERGEKFLVVGENGVGKSTLLKLIVGLLTPLNGSIVIGNNIDLGYYAQEHELLDSTKTILENVRCNNYTENNLRKVLAKFLFTKDDIYKKVSVLSLGERSRVALAKLSLSGANLLLLDEPTNHLDSETSSLISEVFKSYTGTLMVVSHNLDFVDNLGIERILILPSGKISNYDRKIVEHYKVLNMNKS